MRSTPHASHFRNPGSQHAPPLAVLDSLPPFVDLRLRSVVDGHVYQRNSPTDSPVVLPFSHQDKFGRELNWEFNWPYLDNQYLLGKDDQLGGKVCVAWLCVWW